MSVEATLQRFPVFWCFGLRSQPDRKYSQPRQEVFQHWTDWSLCMGTHKVTSRRQAAV